MSNFGTQQYGHSVAFRFNCKMSEEQRIDMQLCYPSIYITLIGKGLTRIEGAEHHAFYADFKLQLDITLAQYKADMMLEHVAWLKHTAKNNLSYAEQTHDLAVGLGEL